MNKDVFFYVSIINYIDILKTKIYLLVLISPLNALRQIGNTETIVFKDQIRASVLVGPTNQPYNNSYLDKVFALMGSVHYIRKLSHVT